MADLPTSFEDERRYYVLAGLAPGQPISRQTDHAKLWIREPFLSSRFNFGKHVVHGHTPVDGGKPDVQRNRTNIDTGAAFGGAGQGQRPAGYRPSASRRSARRPCSLRRSSASWRSIPRGPLSPANQPKTGNGGKTMWLLTGNNRSDRSSCDALEPEDLCDLASFISPRRRIRQQRAMGRPAG